MDQATGYPGTKRPFVEAFTDAYRVKEGAIAATSSSDTTGAATNDESGGLANPFNSAYNDFDDKEPALDWVKQASYNLVSGVVSTAIGGIKLIIGAVQDYADSSSTNKKRKLNDSEDEDIQNAPVHRFTPSGPLPEQIFLDKPAYTSPLNTRAVSSNPIMFSTSDNMVTDEDSNEPRDEALLDDLQKDEKLHQSNRAARVTNETDTPTRVSTSNGGLCTPLLWSRKNNNSTFNNNDKQQLMTPMFRNKMNNNTIMFSPETTPSFNRNPTSSYGTRFNFKQSKRNPTNDNNNNNPETPDTLAARLRNSVLGTYSPPKTVVNKNELSYDLADSVEKQTIEPPTIFRHRETRITSQSGGFLKHLQKRRIQMEMAKEAGFRENVKKWDQELPSSELTLEARAKAYSELIERHKAVKKEVEKLRVSEKEDLKKDAPIVPLQPDQTKKVETLWKNGDGRKVLVTGYKIDVTVNDLRTLKDRQWLNDNVIDFYLSMVSERAQDHGFAFSTHFFSTLEGPRGYKGVERWAKKKKVDVTKLDRVFVPINRQNTHWCLAVVNNKEKKFEFYDSMGGNGRPALELVREYMVLETDRLYPNKKAIHEQTYEGYELCDNAPCPQQENGFDCGVFTCKTVEVLSRDRSLNFSQKDMPLLRRRMAYEILDKCLGQ